MATGKENAYLQVEASGTASRVRLMNACLAVLSNILNTLALTPVSLGLESLADGIFSAEAIFLFASPRFHWKRTGNGAGILHGVRTKHLSEHNWNVLGMQKQPTMQTEKKLQ